MNPIDAITLSTAGLSSLPATAPLSQPRAVSPGSAAQFSQALKAPQAVQEAPQVSDAPAAQFSTIGQSLDIERALMSHLPRADASPAEFAMGLLRAQVKVAQTAIAIELVNKTTQQLSQGVQSLATRS